MSLRIMWTVVIIAFRKSDFSDSPDVTINTANFQTSMTTQILKYHYNNVSEMAIEIFLYLHSISEDCIKKPSHITSIPNLLMLLCFSKSFTLAVIGNDLQFAKLTT